MNKNPPEREATQGEGSYSRAFSGCVAALTSRERWMLPVYDLNFDSEPSHHDPMQQNGRVARNTQGVR
jgi:hypothetical protein